MLLGLSGRRVLVTGGSRGIGRACALSLAQAGGTVAINYVSNETAQPVPQDEQPKSGELPICKPKQETNCINSWEANKTGNRPINYWPGRPASEIDEPLPLNEPKN